MASLCLKLILLKPNFLLSKKLIIFCEASFDDNPFTKSESFKIISFSSCEDLEISTPSKIFLISKSNLFANDQSL